MTGADWRKKVHEFYTFEGAQGAARPLEDWQGGRLVIHICEMPIKCPVAPLEFAFLADTWLREKGLRDKTEIVYVTPLSGAFTKPVASKILSRLLEEKKINVVTDFNIGRVDNEEHKIVSWDEKEVPYDLLVTVPDQHGRPDDRALRPRRRTELRAGRQAHPAVEGPRQHLRDRRRHRRADLQGRLGGALRGRGADREHPGLHRRRAARGEVRRPRQLLHRVRQRQGVPARLQLRPRAGAREIPRSR